MLARRIGLPLLILVCWATVAPAQVALKFKFMEGLRFKNHTTTKIQQSMAFSGLNLGYSINDNRVTQTTNSERDDEGALAVSVKIESLKSDMRFPGGIVIKFDSTQDEAKTENPNQVIEATLETLRKLAASTLTYHLNAENHVESVEGVEDNGLLAKPDDVIKAYQASLELLPDKTLKPGDTWVQTATLGVGPGQVCTFERTYTYAGQATAKSKGGKSLDKITAVDTDVTLASTDSSAGYEVTKCELKIESSEHTFLFDREAGRIIDSRSKVHVRGRVEVSAAQGRYPGDTDLSIESRTEEIE